MRRIDLGYGAVAFEPTGDADRIDTVPDGFFKAHNISKEAALLYQRYRASLPVEFGSSDRVADKPHALSKDPEQKQ